MPKITLDELIEERSEKAVECHMFADAHKDAGATGQASLWKMSAEYAAATAEYLRELRDIKKPH